MIVIRIKISKSICTVVFLAVFFRCGADLIMAYTSAFIHELAHVGMCRYLGVRVYSMKVGTLGMRLDTEYIYDTSKKILIAAAGPLASFILFAVLAITAISIQHISAFFRFAFLNAIIIKYYLPSKPFRIMVFCSSVYNFYAA